MWQLPSKLQHLDHAAQVQINVAVEHDVPTYEGVVVASDARPCGKRLAVGPINDRLKLQRTLSGACLWQHCSLRLLSTPRHGHPSFAGLNGQYSWQENKGQTTLKP